MTCDGQKRQAIINTWAGVNRSYPCWGGAGFASGDEELVAVPCGRFGGISGLGPLPFGLKAFLFHVKIGFSMFSCVFAALSPYPLGLKDSASLAMYPLDVFRARRTYGTPALATKKM